MLETKKLMSFSDEKGLKDILDIHNTMYQQTESQKVVEYPENSDHQWTVIGYPSGMQNGPLGKFQEIRQEVRWILEGFKC